jgi:hypothetical protein
MTDVLHSFPRATSCTTHRCARFVCDELIDKQLATSVWGQAVNERKSSQQADGAVSADGVSMLRLENFDTIVHSLISIFFRIFKKNKKKNKFILFLSFFFLLALRCPFIGLLSASSGIHLNAKFFCNNNVNLRS